MLLKVLLFWNLFRFKNDVTLSPRYKHKNTQMRLWMREPREVLKYRKIPLIHPVCLYGKGQIWWAYIRGTGGGGIVYRTKYASLCQSVKVTFLSFFQNKARILAIFTSCKMWNMFKVKTTDTRIRKVNNKIKNKDTIDAVLASLLLTLNTFHFLLPFLFCWLWSVNGRLGAFVRCSDALCLLESI